MDIYFIDSTVGQLVLRTYGRESCQTLTGICLALSPSFTALHTDGAILSIDGVKKQLIGCCGRVQS